MAIDLLCSQTDLENALGKALVTAIFDDDNDGDVEAAAMTACLEYGTVEALSFLRGTYTFPLTPVPAEMKFAAVDFCCAYAARRRPELAHTLGTDPFKTFYDAARLRMKRFDDSEQRLDPAAAVPSNIDGYVNVETATSCDEDEPARTFDDMGDF